MRRSIVVFKLDMGIVMDDTRMTAEDIHMLLDCMDLNKLDAKPVGHVLRDLDTDQVVLVQDLESGLNVSESYTPSGVERCDCL